MNEKQINKKKMKLVANFILLLALATTVYSYCFSPIGYYAASKLLSEGIGDMASNAAIKWDNTSAKW